MADRITDPSSLYTNSLNYGVNGNYLPCAHTIPPVITTVVSK